MNSVPAVKATAVTAALICGGAAVLVLFFCDPDRVPIYPVCPFHAITGLACPGCGSLRALHALLHGHLLAALHFNVLLVMSLPLVSGFGFRLARNQFRGGPPVAICPVWLWVYLVAVIAFGILRNLPFPVFASFAP
jgi:hypothetical protein